MFAVVGVLEGAAGVEQADLTPASARRLAAQPPEAPEPTTITSNFVAGHPAWGPPELRRLAGGSGRVK